MCKQILQKHNFELYDHYESIRQFSSIEKTTIVFFNFYFKIVLIAYKGSNRQKNIRNTTYMLKHVLILNTYVFGKSFW